MFSLQKPPIESIRPILKRQAVLDFSYPAVGATATSPPAGYVTDRTRIILGSGESIFVAAKAALQRWEHFRLGWVWTGIETVVFGTSIRSLQRLGWRQIDILAEEVVRRSPAWKRTLIGGVMEKECDALFEWAICNRTIRA